MTTFTREKLLDLVWEMTATQLSSEIGFSTTAIRKKCHQYDVPRPPQGYWNKRSHGKNVVNKPKLPPRFPGSSDEIEFGESVSSYYSITKDTPPPARPTFDEDLISVKKRAKAIVGDIDVQKLWLRKDKAISRLLEVDDEIKAENYSWQKPYFDSDQGRRKLKIFNAILIMSKLYRGSARVSTSRYSQTKDDIELHLGDRWHTLRLKENKKGKLELALIGDSRSGRAVQVWADDAESPLELKVSSTFVDLLVLGEQKYRQAMLGHHQWICERIEELKIKAKEDEEKRQQAEILRQKNLEEARVNYLLSLSDNHQKAESIRKFINIVEKDTSFKSSDANLIHEWRDWALERARLIDPLENGEIKRSIEQLESELLLEIDDRASE